jgi:hypothetical protein
MINGAARNINKQLLGSRMLGIPALSISVVLARSLPARSCFNFQIHHRPLRAAGINETIINYVRAPCALLSDVSWPRAERWTLLARREISRRDSSSCSLSHHVVLLKPRRVHVVSICIIRERRARRRLLIMWISKSMIRVCARNRFHFPAFINGCGMLCMIHRYHSATQLKSKIDLN